MLLGIRCHEHNLPLPGRQQVADYQVVRVLFERALRFGDQDRGVGLEFEAHDHALGRPAVDEGFEEFGDGVEVDD